MKRIVFDKTDLFASTTSFFYGTEKYTVVDGGITVEEKGAELLCAHLTRDGHPCKVEEQIALINEQAEELDPVIDPAIESNEPKDEQPVPVSKPRRTRNS